MAGLEDWDCEVNSERSTRLNLLHPSYRITPALTTRSPSTGYTTVPPPISVPAPSRLPAHTSSNGSPNSRRRAESALRLDSVEGFMGGVMVDGSLCGCWRGQRGGRLRLTPSMFTFYSTTSSRTAGSRLHLIGLVQQTSPLAVAASSLVASSAKVSPRHTTKRYANELDSYASGHRAFLSLPVQGLPSERVCINSRPLSSHLLTTIPPLSGILSS
ncbi:hypothetical protein BV22DRAFT_1199763 [Leucogyrophana mollusca]|uniref:Uncharacterized protein n=1 Tax=Leucogyrophana mollusca TaxID=85980 RepID=A0ACB8B253_9AGAM|nr:hypothetical protein BV22DRAFT_1199763 [Leucogyrophana mollusca]